MYLGLNAYHRSDRRSAEMLFRKAIALREKSEAPSANLSVQRAYYSLGRMLLSSGKKREGEELLKKSQELQVADLAQQQKRLAAMNAGSAAVTGKDGVVASYIPEEDNGNSPSVALTPGLANGENFPSPLRGVTRSPLNP